MENIYKKNAIECITLLKEKYFSNVNSSIADRLFNDVVHEMDIIPDVSFHEMRTFRVGPIETVVSVQAMSDDRKLMSVRITLEEVTGKRSYMTSVVFDTRDYEELNKRHTQSAKYIAGVLINKIALSHPKVIDKYKKYIMNDIDELFLKLSNDEEHLWFRHSKVEGAYYSIDLKGLSYLELEIDDKRIVKSSMRLDGLTYK